MDKGQNERGTTEPAYWRGLRELHGESPMNELKAREFMSSVTDDFNLSQMSRVSRKQFLALLTASAAFAASGCTNYRDKGEIVPYDKKPEEVTPGVANYYATTCNGCSQACGILVKTREGRPIKIDGNPDHPVNSGKTCARGQASILNLYDPYRLKKPAFGAQSGKMGDLSWKQADSDLAKHLAECTAASRGIALVTHAIYSPTTKKLLNDFVSTFPTAKVYAYEFFPDDNRRRAWQRCYGSTDLPVVEWEKAKIILALESDFLGTEGHTLEQIRKFAQGRDIMKTQDFNRIYCVEGTMSLTGANADYRLRLRPDRQLEFVVALLNEILLVRRAVPVDDVIIDAVRAVTLKTFAEKQGLAAQTLGRLVDDLVDNCGSVWVSAGDMLPEAVHIAVNYLNEVLEGTRLFGAARSVASAFPLSTAEEWADLVGGMKRGAVGMVVHVDTNPVYHLPAELGYAEALKSVPIVVSLVESDDETSALCTYVLPINHALESWGDFMTRSGLYSLQQPLIAPLHQTRQKEAILLTWINGGDSYSETSYHAYLMGHWKTELFPALNRKVDFETFWHAALHDGVVLDRAGTKGSLRFNASSLSSIRLPAPSAGYAILLTESPFLGDGRFANIGWLQELPHPLSKITWDNYAAVSPGTAKELGLTNNDIVEVVVQNRTLKLPVFVQPGTADQCLSVSLGYGRWNAGPIGTGAGTNANVLLSREGILSGRILTGASVAKMPGRYGLSSTQEHHSLDDAFLKEIHEKRGIIREGTLQQYRDDPEFLHHRRRELFSIAKEVEYKGVKWAMAIDLNKCVGCNVCVSSCNVENNIPVVGKEQVRKGREMQWIRIDRYYSGTPDAPVPSHQPMLCQQCDQAPCENVCPVVATTHSPDGLNQMVYNRCVGTKYCSNNCPYKVRRFNFFNWRDALAEGYYDQEPVSLMHNPEVTVRSRGVMEKCTFCVQRIMEARQHATEQGRSVKGSDVTTACQQACPAEAIVFGDMNDPESDISRYRKHNLGYYVLEEVNTRPNVTYMARLRNIHPEKQT